MIVLVLGATGLLGNAMFRVLSQTFNGTTYGTIRHAEASRVFVPELRTQLFAVRDLTDMVELTSLLDTLKPDVIVNCIASEKSTHNDIAKMLPTFSLFPQLLSHLCRHRNIRLVHISSDGVFSGMCGGYTEEDLPDSTQPYGIAKLLGEVAGTNTLTLRTSIIGPEIQSKNALLEWFLSQGDECICYTHAIFSGFPSNVLAQIICDVIQTRPDLHGLYHLATNPISKYDLLQLIAEVYQKTIRIIPDDSVVIDRSLVADRFMQATGYVPPDWPELIETMHSYNFGLKD